jgi:hypothetical protein
MSDFKIFKTKDGGSTIINFDHVVDIAIGENETSLEVYYSSVPHHEVQGAAHVFHFDHSNQALAAKKAVEKAIVSDSKEIDLRPMYR